MNDTVSRTTRFSQSRGRVEATEQAEHVVVGDPELTDDQKAHDEGHDLRPPLDDFLPQVLAP
jgi:hypothetical protein